MDSKILSEIKTKKERSITFLQSVIFLILFFFAFGTYWGKFHLIVQDYVVLGLNTICLIAFYKYLYSIYKQDILNVFLTKSLYWFSVLYGIVFYNLFTWNVERFYLNFNKYNRLSGEKYGLEVAEISRAIGTVPIFTLTICFLLYFYFSSRKSCTGMSIIEKKGKIIIICSFLFFIFIIPILCMQTDISSSLDILRNKKL